MIRYSIDMEMSPDTGEASVLIARGNLKGSSSITSIKIGPIDKTAKVARFLQQALHETYLEGLKEGYENAFKVLSDA